jgi:uncharacterized coiled-coil protein SlyX
MDKPTGKLAFAHNTIINLEATIAQQKERIAELEKDAERLRLLMTMSGEMYQESIKFQAELVESLKWSISMLDDMCYVHFEDEITAIKALIAKQSFQKYELLPKHNKGE